MIKTHVLISHMCLESTPNPTTPPLTQLNRTRTFVHVHEYIKVVCALTPNTFIASSNETIGIFRLLHPLVKVHLLPFVNDFHFEIKITLIRKHLFLRWLVHHIFLLVAPWVWCTNFYKIVLS
jgi:hypothetical protein